jgi:adenylate cyclase
VPSAALEQYFTGSVAAALASDSTALAGREREITMLFLDVPAFEGLAVSLGPDRAFAMLTELADLATGFIEETEGVFVDGSGASLLAMWNAPLETNEHAWKACIAAQRLTAAVHVFSDRWKEESGLRLLPQAAVATFTAAVGPTSGTRRLSYGPIDGGRRLRSYAAAARGLGVGILVTAETRSRLPADLALRRLGAVDLPLGAGVEDMFELLPGPPAAEWFARRDAYERALRFFEQDAFRDAADELSDLVRNGWHEDVPSLRLLARSIEQQALPVNLSTVYPPRSGNRSR